MNNKLICPFCGKKLWYDEQDGIYRCMKFACDMNYEGATEQLWQALIQAKQDLEIARETLEELKECRFQGGEQSVKLGVRVVAQAALETIGARNE